MKTNSDQLNVIDSDNDNPASDFLKSFDPAQVGAAFSKLIAASVGDLVVVLSRSSAHKHYSLADIEWMVMPPVSAGQFCVAEAMDNQHGYRAPVAVATWAFVLKKTDKALQRQVASSRGLGPHQWNNRATNRKIRMATFTQADL